MKVSIINLVILITTFISLRVQGQDTVRSVYTGNKIDSIYSNILQQQRVIQVFTPQDYTPGSNKKYDVLYVLDGGNWNTGMINNVQRYEENEGTIPPTIVVSVLGIDRNKDLTPTRIKDWPTSGGGTNFLHFLRDELIPYINKNYPSDGDNTLWGHSLGGLFVVNAWLNEPNTFKSYIAVDPSLWWDDGLILKTAPGKLPALADSHTTLFISGRTGRDGEVMKVPDMDTVLSRLAPPGLKWKVVQYPDETHSSIRLKSTYDGLRFSFGWNKMSITFHPMNGMVVKGQPFKVWCFGDTTNLHYTLDGSQPTFSSSSMGDEVVIQDAATLMVRQLTSRTRYDKSKSGTYTVGSPLKGAAKGKPDIHYAYFEEDSLKPKQEGIIKDKLTLPRKNDYKLIVDGWMEAKETGYYILLFEADAGSQFFLNKQELINCKKNDDGNTYTYIVPLEKGFHPYKIVYPHKNADAGLRLSCLAPSTLQLMNAGTIPFYSAAILEKLIPIFTL
ncbi:alpha/beta hydrolase-fold protein [Chitinophaga sp.]|uniref:alpha/beta hydrolase-fold protein n=1 Tax=Chitinophaga sp. TaxID=1869181 RepID=UPI0031D18E75